MELTVDHDALTGLLVAAARNSERVRPLAGALRADVGRLPAEVTGSVVLTTELTRLAQRWQPVLAVLAEDAEVMCDVLRAVDARYVETELAIAGRLARERDRR